MANVTRLDEYANRDTAAVLRELLDRAEAGEIRGLVFALKMSAKHHVVGMTGAYWADPHEALSVITRMGYRVNQLISSRTGETSTDLMPLR